MSSAVHLGGGVVLRALASGDAGSLARAYRRNREHLAPWDPARTDAFFTEAVQAREIERLLADEATGAAIPLVLDDAGRILGRVNLSGIVRGVFQSANLGYWIDASYAGRGLMSTAVTAALDIARADGLHRVQAGTLLHNAASQAVLRRNGFTEIGVAERYLLIAGRWQDHRLFQRLLA